MRTGTRAGCSRWSWPCSVPLMHTMATSSPTRRGTQTSSCSCNDGFGVWCAARRLNQGRFVWTAPGAHDGAALTQAQFDALIIGLPWARLEQMQRITYV